jgi:hypothetical protein
MFVDRGLDRRLRLRAGRLVFGLGVCIAPVAQRVGVALEMRMNVARHELIAALGGRPIRPVMREQQNAAEPAVRALPQSLEMAHAIPRRADTGKTRYNQILGRVRRNIWRNDGERRHFAEIEFELFQAESDVRPRLLPRFRHMREGNDPPFAAVRRLAGHPRTFLVDAPIGGMRLERLVRGAPDRKHTDIVLASGHGADRRPARCNRHLHHRLRIAFE